MTRGDAGTSRFQDRRGHTLTRLIRRPNRIAHMQILHTDSAARRVDQSPSRKADGTGRKTLLLLQNINRPVTVNRRGDGCALLTFRSGLDLELVFVSYQLEIDRIEFLMFFVDQ